MAMGSAAAMVPGNRVTIQDFGTGYAARKNGIIQHMMATWKINEETATAMYGYQYQVLEQTYKEVDEQALARQREQLALQERIREQKEEAEAQLAKLTMAGKRPPEEPAPADEPAALSQRVA